MNAEKYASTLAYQAHATIQRLQKLEQELKELEGIANQRGKTISRKTGMLLNLHNFNLVRSGQPITLKRCLNGEKECQFAVTVEGDIIVGTIIRKQRTYPELREAIRKHFNGDRSPDIKIK